MNAASTSAALSSCSMPCAANKNETCGAGNLLNVYQINGTLPSTLPSTTSSVSTTTTSGVAPTATSTQGLVYAGCYTDAAATRTLEFFGGAYPNIAPGTCVAMCASAGYAYAGMEYGDEVS
jgi:hypothetical protein